jgi:hypothetical protein
MTGTTYGYASLSEVTLTALEDTGWYSCDMGAAEPLLWGDYRSIIGAKKESFAQFGIGRPGDAFPQHYIAHSLEEAEDIACTYDHRAIAVSLPVRDCQGRSTGECQFPLFYDSAGAGVYGPAELDYIATGVPYQRCFVPLASDDSEFGRGHTFAPGSFCTRTKLLNRTNIIAVNYIGDCYAMDCDAQNNLMIWVGDDGLAVKCTAAGQQKTINGYSGHIECPDPNILCGIMRQIRAYTPPPAPPPSRTPSSSPRVPTVSYDLDGEIIELVSTSDTVLITGNGRIEAAGTNATLNDLVIASGSQVFASGIVLGGTVGLFGSAAERCARRGDRGCRWNDCQAVVRSK